MSVRYFYFLLCLLFVSTVDATIPQNAKIALLIHSDFVRNAVKDAFTNEGYSNVVVDSIPYDELERFFVREEPCYVVVDSSGIESVDLQLLYETKVVALAQKTHVQKLLALSFFSVYPEKAKIPLQESDLTENALRNAQDPYAVAKLAILKLCQKANDPQRPRFVFCPYPYIYGKNDPSCKTGSLHPLYHIVSRIQQAKNEKRPFTVISNDGEAYYELLHSKDFARAVLTALSSDTDQSIINLTSGRDSTIKDLTETSHRLSGFTGEVLLDINCYDEVKRRVLAANRIQTLGFTATVSNQEGITEIFSNDKNKIE